ncbi:hypothetical protein GOODEAATRI_015129 [Goodea atripinnis]|uniref:Uncharacterized protein n=1 Tax=Goodea atripinnis TaxID=208336 RepID=A0ABV0PNZ5_9TELE
MGVGHVLGPGCCGSSQGLHFHEGLCFWRAGGDAFAQCGLCVRLLLWVLFAAFCPPLCGGPVRGGSGLQVCVLQAWRLHRASRPYTEVGFTAVLSGSWWVVCAWGWWSSPCPYRCMEGCMVLAQGEPRFGSVVFAWLAWLLVVLRLGGGVRPFCCACCGLSVPPFGLLGWRLSLGHGGGHGGASRSLLNCLAGPGGFGSFVYGRCMCLYWPGGCIRWACHFGSDASCWRSWCWCGMCFVAPLAWLWLRSGARHRGL